MTVTPCQAIRFLYVFYKEKMFNDRRRTEYARKLRMQKIILLGITGVLAYEIINSYLNFHNQVSQYTQSIAYREAQEASKEYSMKLMKRNQQLLSREEKELNNKNRYQDTD
ncbi:uncharacterized protein LOC112493653 [Cephus cinctus]|uniref:Uncharacterized protein LOC112493653 n=1 Tax=Cephus cinctus TaxID=211228 RepID=A0AAJ7VWV5_CEPCN|nr:uncharacterized protein LOC112493653 [Cephus cinctus]